MAEKEYIERGALMEELQEEIDYEMSTHTDNETKWICGGLRVAMRDIRNQPAADVVEVVRCKDCVHYQTGACNHFGYYTYAPDVDEDDYCSYGERKEQK